MEEVQDLSHKCHLSSSQQPSTSVPGPEWVIGRSLSFPRGIREGIQGKTSVVGRERAMGK